MQKFLRPLILLSLLCIIETFLILTFPEHYLIIFFISVSISIITLILSLRESSVIGSLSFVFVLLFCAVVCYHSYAKHENNAKLFINQYSKENHTFLAEILECNSYSSYCIIDACLLSKDGKTLPQNLRCRLSSYSTDKFEKGDKIKFISCPQDLSKIESDNFDTRNYLRSKRIFIYFSDVTVISTHSGNSTSFLSSIKKHVKDRIFKYIPKGYDFDSASISYAMLMGDKEYLRDDVKDYFSQSGLSHILCVSGMHLTIIMNFLFYILTLLTIPKKSRCFILFSFCFFYIALTGFSISAIRAGIITCISLVALVTSKKTDAYLSLFFAAIVICIFSPYSTLDISARLSFFATFGIITFSDVFSFDTTRGKLKNALYSIFCAIIANTGAVVFSMPIIAYSFKSISLFSIISTLFVSFACEMLLISLIFLSIVPAFEIFEGLLSFAGTICHYLCSYILKVAQFFSSFTFSEIETKSENIFVLIFICLTVLLCIFVTFNLKGIKIFTTFVILIICISYTFYCLLCNMLSDNIYKVSYYRKSENDRQLSIKMASFGYLLVNADNNIATNVKNIPFDKKHGNNYLLIIPDEIIKPKILVENIKYFDKRFGLNKVFVPDTEEGNLLAQQLYEYGVLCYSLPSYFFTNGITIQTTFTDEHSSITISDSKDKCQIVYADRYKREYFETQNDICAFFTRNTSNQFNPVFDTSPDCRVFYTRLSRDDSAHGIFNTHSKKSFYIKE